MLTNNVKLYVQADTGKHEEGKKKEAIKKKKLLEMKNIIIKGKNFDAKKEFHIR